MFKNVYYNSRTNNIHLWSQINGKDKYNELKWIPYVFIDDENGTIKSIEGNTVSKKTFNTYNDYFIYQKSDLNCKENNLRPEIQYLAERYHEIPDDEIENPKLKIYSIDIEVDFQDVFPKAEDALAPVVLISVYNMLENKTTTFGIKEYNGKYKKEPWLTYIHCKNEEVLLQQFFGFMHKYAPDVITGWNCIPITNTIYKEKEIVLLSDISKGDILPSGDMVNIVYPRSFKKVNEIKLSNGHILKTSADHVIPIKYIDNNKYTKLSENRKNKQILNEGDMKVSDIPFLDKSCFVQVPFDLNKNDNIDIDNNLLYMAGLIYTDGSMRDKTRQCEGYRIYQSNTELLEQLPYVTTSICGDRKKGYSRHIKHSIIKDVYDYIYNEAGEKTLNLTLLSRLSKEQFYIFLSGVLDGDGCKSDVGMGLCDYTSDGIDKLYDLCLWNGIFVTRSKNTMRFIEYDETKLYLNHPYRWSNMRYNTNTRTSSQKASQIRFKKIDECYYIKIDDIKETDETVEMGDIKTSSNYFITSGVRVHNCISFDIQYLINRTLRIFGEDSKVANNLSPISNVRTWINKDGEFNADIIGVTLLDYLDVYKWYSPAKLERYTLDYVSNHELEKGKVDYSAYKDLRQLYNENWDLYVEYNIIDAYRVGQIEGKLGYIKLIQTLSLLCKAPMKFYHTQTALIEGILITYFRRNGLCAPTFYGGVQEGFPAAFVKEPLTGLHKWVIDLDIISSYPTAIVTLNMSNETYYGRIIGFTEDQMISHMKNRDLPEFDMLKDTGKVRFSGRKLEIFQEALKKKFLCVAPCGSVFSTTVPGVIATVEKSMFYKRVEVKKKMIKMKKSLPELKGKDFERTKEKIARYQGLQNALKIILNSTYGILAVPFSRYFNTNIAEAIVSCGRQTIKASERYVNQLYNKPSKALLDVLNNMERDITKKPSEDVDLILYMDTDSLFINVGRLFDLYGVEWKNKTDEYIMNHIHNISVVTEDYVNDKAYREMQRTVYNSTETDFRIKFKREIIAKSILFVKKKKYSAWIVDEERNPVDKIKTTGLEIVRSDTPEVVRPVLKDIMSMILKGSSDNELSTMISKCKKELQGMPPEAISTNIGIHDTKKYIGPDGKSVKGTPMQIKGVANYRALLKILGLEGKYEDIMEDAKVKVLYVKKNKFGFDAMAFNRWPKEFDSVLQVDYTRQIEKTFLNKCEMLLKVLGKTDLLYVKAKESLKLFF